jgi:hypothetical protein
MVRNIGGRGGQKIWEEEMVRNFGGTDGQKCGRRRWLEILGEGMARNIEGGDG